VIVPVTGPAVGASEVTRPLVFRTGVEGIPSASTPSCPGKTMETGSASVLRRITVTSSPSSTQSTGPGCWNPPNPLE
jgi:hypothetical protein